MTLDDDLPPILTVEQTAKLLGISRGLAFTAVRAGDIPSIRIGAHPHPARPTPADARPR